MAASKLLLDTGILIDFVRKQDKSKSIFYALANHYSLLISVITDFEITVGTKTERHAREYQTLLESLEILPLDRPLIQQAARIHLHLKAQNSIIAMPDLFIGATATHFQMPIVTFNRGHFERIPRLVLFDVNSVAPAK